jgi:pimeloyl-ACP methyl ester carboxylesterase
LPIDYCPLRQGFGGLRTIPYSPLTIHHSPFTIFPIFAPMTLVWKKRLLKGLLLLVIVYLAIGAGLYFFQENLLFHPTSLTKDHRFRFSQAFEEVNLQSRTGLINLLIFRPVKEPKGLVVFFHGNKHNVEHYAKYPSFFTENGYEVWMIDYPGFGKSTGEISEAILYEQALLVFDSAREKTGSENIAVYGKSIGTGIASYVAAHRKCSQLILETPYYNIRKLASHYFPIYPSWPPARYQFPNDRHLKEVEEPVIIIHGTEDEVVPYEQGQKLAKENPQIRMVTVNGGKHNDLSNFPIFIQTLNQILN